MLFSRVIMDLASFYKCLSDPTRLRIVSLLVEQGPLCVCDLQECLGEPQVKMSKHIGYMRKFGLLEMERKANWNFYRVASDLPPMVTAALQAFQEHRSAIEPFATDLETLRSTKRAACC